MRSLVDIVDSMTGVVRAAIGAALLFGLGIGLLATLGVSYVAPKVAEDYGERVERLGEEAIDAAREQSRNRELAKDGWGYAPPSRYEGIESDGNGTAIGGWGEGTE